MKIYFPFFLLWCCCLLDAFSQITRQQLAPVTSKMRLLGSTRPLRDISPLLLPSPSRPFRREAVPNKTKGNPTRFPETNPVGGDPIRQRSHQNGGLRGGGSIIVEPKILFDGLDYTDVEPPDPTGAVGTNHFVAMVNSLGGAVMQIFDKQGNSLYGPANLVNLWQEVSMTGLGDPIVVYDRFADRWLLSELSGGFDNVLLVAISRSPDPLDEWDVYSFQTLDFPDYPKYTVWRDAYYVTTNEYGDNADPIYALDRNAMLNGLPNPDIQRFAVPKFEGIEFELLTGVDLEGNNLGVASPACFIRPYDNAWAGGEDKVEVWEVSVNWNDPNLSVLEGPTELFTEPFEASVCEEWSICIEQPDNATKMAALEQIFMFRPTYRSFGSFHSIVCQHTTDVDGNDLAGIRWYELRNTNGTGWTIHQQGTYSPDDGDSRFMGCIAQDYAGNIALGYSVSSSTTYPSLRFTGQLANSTLNEMNVEEYEVATGLGTTAIERFGDYSHITLDPLDDRTFWFVGEYMGVGAGNWKTKIAAFEIKRDTNDIGPFLLLEPQTSAFLTNAETVKVGIRNHGYNPQSNFQVAYQVDGGTIITETVSTTVLPEQIYEHTFAVPADLSEVAHTYQFKIFTTLNTDTNPFNDTIRVNVYKTPMHDANPYTADDLEENICAYELNTNVSVRNRGGIPMTSLTLNYRINNGEWQTQQWTGNVAPNETALVPIFIDNLLNGDNLLEVQTENPNGQTDQNPINDTFSLTFWALPQGAGIAVNLSLDEYPEEISWEIADENGDVVMSGNNYFEIGAEITEYSCVLPNACYTFTIFDSFGDGLFGSGSFSVIDENGNILVENVIFNNSYSADFCIEEPCAMTAEASIYACSTPIPNTGCMTLFLDNAILPVNVLLNGQILTFNTSICYFENLSYGNYNIIVIDANGCSDGTQAVVNDQTVSVTDISTEQPQIRLYPNPSAHHVSIEIDGLPERDFSTCQLYDVQGSLMMRVPMARFGGTLRGVFSLNNYPEGIYFVRLPDLPVPQTLRLLHLE